ncbi:MAG: patatin-like phospholipase family protein [Candidatus Aquilonibacter sp.]
MMPDRRGFLMTLGMAGAMPALLGAASDVLRPARRALVLSGGGALGSYAAGIIGCLATAAGVKDGTVLPPYELVCGTSIGALNGWFVATGQYTKLHDLWYGVSADHIIQFKPQFAALRDPQAGAGDRAIATIRVASLTKDQNAFFDSKPVVDWVTRNLDPERPLVMPLVWATTNLTMQQPEYLYMRPANAPPGLNDAIVRNLKVALGPQTVVREASADLFHKQIFASFAVPLLWDPVQLPGPDGTVNQYCDGGVAANSPVSVAHAVATGADVILLNPAREEISNYENAIEVSAGMFSTMQQKILSGDMRSVYFQSVAKRAFARLSNSDIAIATEGEAQLAAFIASLPPTELTYIRPKNKLPVGGAAFDDQRGIGEAYRIGWNDAIAGFTPYDWKTFDA